MSPFTLHDPSPVDPRRGLPPRKFRVSTGHQQVVVQAADEADAIRQARKLMAMEMPRLWDLIYTKQSSEFVVVEE